MKIPPASPRSISRRHPAVLSASIAALLACALAAPAVQAVDYNWNVGNDGNWNNAAQWNPNGVPNSTTDTATMALANGTGFAVGLSGGPFTVNQLSFTGQLTAVYSFQNGTLIFDGAAPMVTMEGHDSVFVNVGYATLESSASFQLNATTTFNVVFADSVLTASGAITGGGGLTKTGLGTLNLFSTNTYTGGTTVSDGTLQLGDGTNPAALVAGAGADVNMGSGGEGGTAVVVNALATLSIAAGATVTGGHGGTTLGMFDGGGKGGDAVASQGTVTNAGTITGGDGGAAANIDAGVGGDGGSGVSVSNGGSLTNTGSIAGGVQGSGTDTPGIHGTGVVVTNGGTVINSGTISDGVTSNTAAATLSNLDGGTINGGVTMQNFANAVTLGSGSTINGDLNIGTASGATLLLNGIGTQDYSAAVTGTTTFDGALTKAGTGTWIITQALTYSGGTSIQDGILKLGQGGITGSALGTGDVTIGAAGTFTLDLAVGETFANNIINNGHIIADDAPPANYTIASTITGLGDLTKTGPNTVTLTGNNTYSGGTSIDGGGLLVNNTAGSGTGTGSVVVLTGARLGGSGTISGPVTLNAGGTIAPGATLTVPSTATLRTGTVTWNGGSTLALELGSSDLTSDRLTITGALLKGSGMGFNVNVSDSGGFGDQQLYTLIDFTAGTTFLPADFTLALPMGFSGTLSLDADSLDLMLAFATTTTLIQNTGGPNTPVFAAVTVDGAGTTGGPTDDNTIASLLLTPGSTLQIFNQLTVTGGQVGDTGPGTTGIFGGTLFGPNGLFFNVGGTMNVTSTLLGDLTKTGDGSLYLNGTLIGNLRVLAGLFGGNASIFGNLFNAGIVSPGNSPGTIAVSGNYTQSAAGTLRIEVGGRRVNQFDRLLVGGRALLDGTLQLVRLNDFDLKRGDKITFLIAQGGVDGEFATVSNPFTSDTILQPTVVYGDQEVSLELIRGSFADYAANQGLTPNQRAVAKALDRVSADQPNDQALVYLDERKLEKLPGDFDKIAPEELSSIFTISTALATVQSINLQRRTDDLRKGASGFSAGGLAMQGTGPGYSGSLFGAAGPGGHESKASKEMITPITPEEKKWGAFLTGVGEWVDVDGDGNARGYDITTGGFSLGLDYKVTPNFAVGLMAGYAGTAADLVDDGRVWVNGGKLGLYATYFTGGFYLDTAVTGGYNSYDTKRSALQGTARGNTDGGELNALVGTGYDWKVGTLTIGPTATFNYTLVGVEGFTEHGSLAPLQIDRRHAESVRSALGFKASTDWKCGGVIIRPELRAAWQHEYGDESYDIGASFADGAGNSFLVNGPEIGRDSLLLGAGFAIQCSETFSTYLYYDGELGRERYDRHSISGGVRVAF